MVHLNRRNLRLPAVCRMLRLVSEDLRELELDLAAHLVEAAMEEISDAA